MLKLVPQLVPQPLCHSPCATASATASLPLRYTTAVLKETLRLRPPTNFARVAPDGERVELAGYDVSGCILLVSPYVSEWLEALGTACAADGAAACSPCLRREAMFAVMVPAAAAAHASRLQ